MPRDAQIFAIARMAAFIPGASPPDVRIAIVFTASIVWGH
jgi:hypothetical protein